jgi:type IV pilus assembly protein PilA
MHRFMRTKREEGFTLIELLSVIVILGVLAGIAIPALMKHRDRAAITAMRADLRSIVTSETAWDSDHDAYTDDVTDLTAEGYRQSRDITAHIKLVGDAFVACTQHRAVVQWLVYDSATSTTSTSPTDCA